MPAFRVKVCITNNNGHLQGYLLEFQNVSRLIICVHSIFKDVSLLGVICMENDDCLSII